MNTCPLTHLYGSVPWPISSRSGPYQMNAYLIRYQEVAGEQRGLLTAHGVNMSTTCAGDAPWAPHAAGSKQGPRG